MTKPNLQLILNRIVDTILPPVWLAEVQDIVATWSGADPAEQADTCGKIGAVFGEEAEREAGRLFEAQRPTAIKQPAAKPASSAASSGQALRRELEAEKAKPIGEQTEIEPEVIEPSPSPKPPAWNRLAQPVPPKEPKPDRPYLKSPKQKVMDKVVDDASKVAFEGLIVSKETPLDSAMEFIKRKCQDANGVANLHFWQGQFYQWSGSHYRLADPTVIEREVLFFLDRAKQSGGGRFLPKPATVRDIMFCLEKCLALDAECQPPAWLPEGDPAQHIIAFRNRAVNMRTGATTELTPELWIHNVLEFDWDPSAEAPRWQRFLEEVFPNDPQSQDFLEEWMGYCMTDEVNLHKGAMFTGKPRSGKGTITHIINALVGDSSYCSLNFSHWASTENSQQVMIGKRVGVFPDVRLKAAKPFGFKGQSGYDPGGLSHQSQALLLTITGGDKMTVYRKMLVPWIGILPTKLMILSNEPLNLNDATLITRWVKLHFGVSFAGNPDIYLLEKLRAELPGIAARCVAAYQRLCARGEFIQPKSGLALERAIVAASNPFAAFMFECFRWNPESIGTTKEVVRSEFECWCNANGHMDLFNTTPANKMGEHISSVKGFEKLNLARYRPIDPLTRRQSLSRWACVELIPKDER